MASWLNTKTCLVQISPRMLFKSYSWKPPYSPIFREADEVRPSGLGPALIQCGREKADKVVLCLHDLIFHCQPGRRTMFLFQTPRTGQQALLQPPTARQHFCCFFICQKLKLKINISRTARLARGRARPAWKFNKNIFTPKMFPSLLHRVWVYIPVTPLRCREIGNCSLSWNMNDSVY